MMKLIAIGIGLSIAACADDSEVEVLDEPALTATEVSALPVDGMDEHEHASADVLEAEPLDDGAIYDDDEAELLVDEAVTDDGEVQSIVDTLAFQPLLRAGLHPRASDGLRAAGVAAWRITQTVGNAPASAGVHQADGSVNGRPYTAAVDLSTRNLTTSQIHNLLERLAKVGFAAWYRKTGSDGWSGSNHIHAVYANSMMKSALRSQVRSWLVGRNGLVSNTSYGFHAFSARARSVVQAKFAQSNQGTSNGGAGLSARVNTSGAALTIRASASTTAAAVGSVSDGSFVTIRCQTYGTSVSGTYGTSRLWDKISGGYIADAFVATGSDGRIGPLCP
ncbi:MAG: hypothetical protein M3680_31550 [Myxococcota bacterium]|nr:hypothetical protein [Myxococcota bacterium]